MVRVHTNRLVPKGKTSSVSPFTPDGKKLHRLRRIESYILHGGPPMGACLTGEIPHMKDLPDELQTETSHAAEATTNIKHTQSEE